MQAFPFFLILFWYINAIFSSHFQRRFLSLSLVSFPPLQTKLPFQLLLMRLSLLHIHKNPTYHFSPNFAFIRHLPTLLILSSIKIKLCPLIKIRFLSGIVWETKIKSKQIALSFALLLLFSSILFGPLQATLSFF